MRRRPFTPADDEVIIRLHPAPHREIAAALSRTPSSVASRIATLRKKGELPTSTRFERAVVEDDTPKPEPWRITYVPMWSFACAVYWDRQWAREGLH